MSAPQAPHRALPANPSREHLRKEAKRLAKSHGLQLATAQRRLAREYGHSSWSELMRAVDGPGQASPASSLALAAARADEAAVRELLSGGHRPNGENHDINTSLWLACASDAPADRRIAIATLLLAAGASPRETGENQTTPLHQAARRGPRALVELLIRHGAFYWQPDRRRKTALDYARKGVASDREQIVELLDRPVIRDPNFRAAVKAIHAGDVAALNGLLDHHPALLHERAIEPDCYSQDYFRDPKLFWFIANNPTLMRTVPANIVDVGRAMIARGVEQADLDYTLELVMSSGSLGDRQVPLMTLLVEAGAIATPASIRVALAHRELTPVLALLDRGLAMTAPIAAALGRTQALASLLAGASPEERHEALGMAVINRQLESARVCLDAGADPNRFLPVHRHSTPLHQASVNDDIEMLKLLVARGARLDTRDTLWNGTPLGWAVHTRKGRAEAYLRSLQQAPD